MPPRAFADIDKIILNLYGKANELEWTLKKKRAHWFQKVLFSCSNKDYSAGKVIK
jgi:hypothetical protein